MLSTCVVEVRWRPPPIQAKRPLLDRRDERGQDRRVARAPHEARPHDDRLEAVAVRVAHRLLGHRLGGGVERPSSPAAAERPRSRSRAARPPAAPPRCRRARSAARPRRGGLERVARAADVDRARTPRACPTRRGGRRRGRRLGALGAGAHRVDVVEVAAHRLRAERATPSSADASERASARTRQPVADQALGSAGRR